MKKTFITILFMTILSVLLPVTIFAAEGEQTTIRVGWFNYPRGQEVRDGKNYGYNYDYLVEIAKYTDWEYEFVQEDYNTCMKMLEDGDIDLIAGLAKTEDRELIYSYPDLPYGQTYSVLFANADSPLQEYDFDNYNDLNIGILDSTTNDEILTKYANDNGFSYNLLKYNSTTAIQTALGSEIDAAVLTSYIPTSEYKMLAKFSPQAVYIVTTKGNTKVLSGLNKALNSIKMDNFDFEAGLYQKHYVENEIIDLTIDEKAIVEASKSNPVLIGVIDNNAPISFWNKEEDKYEGITIDMLNAVSKKTGLNFEYVHFDLSELDSNSLNTDAPQIVLGVTNSKKLSNVRDWYLSNSVLVDSLAIVGLRGRNFLTEEKKLKVAVMADLEVSLKYAKQYMSEFEIVEYQTIEECLDAVENKTVDATIYMKTCISYLLQKPSYNNLEIMPTYSESVDICVVSLTNEFKEYVSIINKGLMQVTENESRSIVLNYTINNPYILSFSDFLYKYRIPVIIITCLVIFVIASLFALYLNKRNSDIKVKEALGVAKQASAAKGNFMSRMSHEIRTPLNAVIGYNTIARNEMAEAKSEAERKQAEMKVMDCLMKSDIASRHLLTIINDVLDMSSIESGKIKVVNERFDFKGLTASLTAIFYSQAKGKGVDFDVVFDEEMDEWIIGDQMRVNQIFTNLLSNAIKFTTSGGKVTLLIHPVTKDDFIKVHFEVSDTGIGMSDEYMERIWAPFEQADSSISRRFGGTGLGLSITKALVDLLNGSISVKSKVGEGSTFYVDLEFTRTKQPENAGVYDFSSINALIVDDDISTCNYIQLLLTRSGVRSSAVYSGEEAIEAVNGAIGKNSPYTICLVDWRMPKMDGLETIKHIREIAGPNLPIIVITAYDFSEVADRAAEVGVNKFISKPLFQSSLFNLLANVSGNPNIKNDDKLGAYDFSGSRVLLVEDNEMNMEIACRILASTKMDVDCAYNGQEAVDKFLSLPQGTYSAILMDVQMPIMDGYIATKKIRESQHPEAKTIPIIAMTADAFAENIAESKAAGMNDHISKPISLPVLFRTLNKYIKK